ncbi:hypothetical protein AFLA70_178g002031 [Aspergillus flavus AF70]|nr:hypothetical protein AFLA70_178g002031 [Aspergillus flavus AF70]
MKVSSALQFFGALLLVEPLMAIPVAPRDPDSCAIVRDINGDIVARGAACSRSVQIGPDNATEDAAALVTRDPDSCAIVRDINGDITARGIACS